MGEVPGLKKSAAKPVCYAVGMAQQLLIWESEVTAAGDGRAVVVARKPLYRMTRAEAARLLGCSEWTVSRLYRLGILSGWKPGAGTTKRKDGKASNAAVVLDAGSVLEYKAATAKRGVF